MPRRIAIQVSPIGLRLAAGTPDGRIERTLDEPAVLAADPPAAVARLAAAAAPLLADDVGRIAIAFPGSVDAGAGRVLAGAALPRWAGFDLAPAATRAIGRPCAVAADVACAALAEAALGAGRGGRRVFFATLGETIDAAAVLDGRLPGRAGGGAFGQTLVWDRDAGQYAPLESVCGRWGLEARARRWVGAGRLPTLGARAGGEPGYVNVPLLADALRENLPEALDLVDAVAADLAIALAAVVALLDPDRIVLGGSLAAALGPPLLDHLETHLREACFEPSQHRWTLAPATLGPDAPLAGALLL